MSAARNTQIPFAQRDIFLDHVQEAEAIRTQIRRLIHAAKTHGEAIGIGHPHSLTYQVLKEELPNLKKEIRLVPASELVHIVG
ncbi:MAG: divergent polysaccharide deacetylase family protein [Desulfobacteraceae bacterium]|nr:divergent polysaccharide deacetylase family protein [Desulfobacteraceae bacterium]